MKILINYLPSLLPSFPFAVIIKCLDANQKGKSHNSNGWIICIIDDTDVKMQLRNLHYPKSSTFHSKRYFCPPTDFNSSSHTLSTFWTYSALALYCSSAYQYSLLEQKTCPHVWVGKLTLHSKSVLQLVYPNTGQVFETESVPWLETLEAKTWRGFHALAIALSRLFGSFLLNMVIYSSSL